MPTTTANWLDDDEVQAKVKNHPSISKIADKAIDRYWDTFAVDALDSCSRNVMDG